MLEFLGDCTSMRLEYEVEGTSAVLMRVCDVWGFYLYIYMCTYVYMYVFVYTCDVVVIVHIQVLITK